MVFSPSLQIVTDVLKCNAKLLLGYFMLLTWYKSNVLTFSSVQTV